jgi:hypothetical protein
MAFDEIGRLSSFSEFFWQNQRLLAFFLRVQGFWWPHIPSTPARQRDSTT